MFGWFSRRSAAPTKTIDQLIGEHGSFTSLGSVGFAVTTTAAMQVATVMACVKVIADGCATPELHVYRDAGGKRKLATDVPEYRLLNRRPNEWQSSLEFRRTMTMHAALTGNAVAIKVRVDGRTVELIPLPPGSFSIERPARYRTLYRCYDEFGHLGDFGPEDVFHLPAWQWEVVRGLDALRLARAAVGLSIAAEETQGALHRNGGRPSGVLSTDKTTSPEAVERLRLAWRKFTQEGRSGTAILDNGFTYKPLVQTGVEGQHLETRRFQVEEICRAFGVFPIMIGHSDKAATFASTEAFFGAHVRHTLMPWWQLWRQRLDEFVLDGAGPLFTDFDGRYLLAGSVKDRAMWARTMTEMGIYTRNEIREEEGRDPLPGLDEPLTPMNMSKTGAARSDDQGSSDNAP